MNIERLTVICEWLEAGAPHKDGVDGFDMRGFIDEYAKCGTTCCIGGAAILFFGSKDKERCEPQAQAILGLDYTAAQNLFYGGIETVDGMVGLRTITPAWAARCIRKLIATGEVDWVGTQAA